MNKIMLIGNLTRNPEVSMTMSGKACSKFTIAVNEYNKGEVKTTFVDCVAFDKTADNINRLCNKGKKIYVEGRLNIYDGQTKTGAAYKGFNVVVGTVEFLSPKEEITTYDNAIEDIKDTKEDEHVSESIDVKGWDANENDLPF